MSYLPFLPPLSSFLPFFFMEAPSVVLRMAGAAAGSIRTLRYTSVLRECQEVFESKAEKCATEGWRQEFRRRNSGRAS
jgi:hypothetical protein